jgi:hypothetical protein
LVCSFKTTGVNYRLFNVAEPTRPPKKIIYQKETGLQKRQGGVFHIRVYTNTRGKTEGGGVDFKIATLTVQIIVLCAR